VTINYTNGPRFVMLTQPTNGAVFLAPTNILFVASANDTNDVDGRVIKVEFFSGTNKLAAVSSAPYQCVWSNVSAGGYTFRARATDNLDATTDSASLIITNLQPGFVRLESPGSTNGYLKMLFVGLRATRTTSRRAPT
jgi:hypothetical protein